MRAVRLSLDLDGPTGVKAACRYPDAAGGRGGLAGPRDCRGGSQTMRWMVASSVASCSRAISAS